MKTAIQHKQTETNYTFLDFSSFEELAGNQVILDSLVMNYRDIFSEPEVWAEDYGYDEVFTKLQHELTGDAALRLCVNEYGNDVIGFCWAQVLDVDQVRAAVKSVHYVQENAAESIDQVLAQTIGNKSVIYIQDLGIARAHRGTVSLEHLICPVIGDIAQRANINRLFFWSVEDTCVAWLAQKIGIPVAASFGKIQFFEGQYPD